jgi:tRNA threonylcarbamoyl adenosine modification protein (Sua5/YciO/YrdC/YwlC family)
MILEVQPDKPNQRVIDQAIAVFQRGGLIVFPTDTGYAIGCDLFQKKSIDRIIQIKKRDSKKPLSFYCSDLKELSQFAILNTKAYKAMMRLLPGPYTFVLPATKMVPNLLVSRRSSVGIRVPANPITLALVGSLRHPLIGTSCATPEGKALTDALSIQKAFGKNIDLILDAGKIESEPSTVIDFTTPEPMIIRKGKGKISGVELKEG